jgi:hypothetical protein
LQGKIAVEEHFAIEATVGDWQSLAGMSEKT